MKWDGIRVIADLHDGQLDLTNRHEVNVSATYPELLLPQQLPEDLLVDGEVVALNDRGVPSLQAIAPRMHVRNVARAHALQHQHPVTYMVFDVLRCHGVDLSGSPLAHRRGVLERLRLPDRSNGKWQCPQAHDDGAALAQFTQQAGLEGVMSKQLSSAYTAGVRSPHWVKTPHRTERVVVVGGWTPMRHDNAPTGQQPDTLGALWVGLLRPDGTLAALGRVGSGLGQAQRAEVVRALRSFPAQECPFDPPVRGPDARRAIWVEPVLCVQVRHLGVTEAGMLRQPVLRALRPDVRPGQAQGAELLQLPNEGS